jgi:hypothetical protein
LIKPQRRPPARLAMLEQRLINSHIPRPAGRRVDIELSPTHNRFTPVTSAVPLQHRSPLATPVAHPAKGIQRDSASSFKRRLRQTTPAAEIRRAGKKRTVRIFLARSL